MQNSSTIVTEPYTTHKTITHQPAILRKFLEIRSIHSHFFVRLLSQWQQDESEAASDRFPSEFAASTDRNNSSTSRKKNQFHLKIDFSLDDINV